MTPVTIVGMAAGSLLILTAAAIFWSQKAFPAGGIAVSVVAFAMIGMSQWTTIKIEAGGAKMEVTREEVLQIAAATNELADQAENVAAAIEVSKAQIRDVLNVLENRDILSAAAAQPIRHRLNTAPTIDIDRIQEARSEMWRVMER